MNVRHVYQLCAVAALLVLNLSLAQHKVAAGQPDQVGAENGVEVLTRGPVHEAFAETIAFDPEPGVIVPKAPPEPIEELPPEQKPEGANVDWIPGYWAWDDERDDFLWVSGIWRALPPGRQWVPGYWGRAGRGSQWISGYWADAQASEIDYLPEPPQTVEAGPNIDPPSADHTWLPGCWIWQQNRYAWRPGYWAVAQPNWVWIPAHYSWSPRGYVFIDGYYDYSVARRGVLFAPVYFSSSIYSQRGYFYSPRTVINPAVFARHLFLRPSYGHYYFGDYYASSYTSRGFSPWFSFASSRSGYDPFYAHQRWNHRNDGQWDRGVAADFAHRRDHEEARPPHNWAAQRDRSSRGADSDDRSFVVAASLDELAKSKEAPVRFQPVAKDIRQQIEQRAKEVRQVRAERQRLEAEMADRLNDPAGRSYKPGKVKAPRTPYVAAPIERLGKDDAPPPRIEAPQPDIKIEPKPRKPRGNTEAPRREPTQSNPVPQPDRPALEPKPEPPKAEPKEAPKGGSGDRPKGEPKGGSKGKGKGKPQN